MKGLFAQETKGFDGPAKHTDGHAAPVGSGPPMETCGTCEHVYRRRNRARTYIKCALMEPLWTCGPGTDIRCKDKACRCWGPQKENNDGRD